MSVWPVIVVQVQPLSLEELLAKKKAEEEAEAKVRCSSWYVFYFFLLESNIIFPKSSFLFLTFSAQVPLKGRARSWGSETQRTTDRREEENAGRREEEKKDVSGHREKNARCVSASNLSLVVCFLLYGQSLLIITQTVRYRGPSGTGETRAERAYGAREQREWGGRRPTEAQRGER